MTGFYIFLAVLSALTLIICTALVAGNKLAVEKEKTKQETVKAAMQKAQNKK